MNLIIWLIVILGVLAALIAEDDKPMASKKKMAANALKRAQAQKKAETRSRAQRNRVRNYIKSVFEDVILSNDSN